MRIAVLAGAVLCFAQPQDPVKEQLKQTLKDQVVGPGWIYDQIDVGFAEAKKTGKPMLVVFR